ATSIHSFGLEQVRELGVVAAAEQAIRELQKSKVDGFWVHLDADVLDDEIMPAVDYRLGGGLRRMWNSNNIHQGGNDGFYATPLMG
ncbi:MAG TPA: hypothetical protein VJZ16_03650, partial [Syntrophales bacterium]|nr:hypothetical protein [Syntrophales bacterium]